MKTIRDRFARWSVVGVLMTLAATAFYVPTASAHGEKSQAAFMRMRTIHWYDLNWSADRLNVNESMEVTGKFRVFKGWPQSVALPEVSFLNIGIPGPVLTRQESYINDVLTPRSVELKLGGTYDFKVVLKARRPGDWHVHTMLNVYSGGPIIGPGKWVTIEGSLSDYTSPITTLTGQTVDIESFYTGTIVGWHLFWYIVGIAWMVYWCRKPVFIPRLLKCDAGGADELITDTDKKVAIGFLAATLVVALFGYNSANGNYPITIPLQAGTIRGIDPLPEEDVGVTVKLEKATYRVPGRAMQMVLTVTNNHDHPIEIGEFYTASVRFLNSNVFQDETNYPPDLLAEDGLTLDDNEAIGPGQTKTVTVTASDAAWEVQRLSDIIYDPDSQMAGLLFFFGGGERHVVEIAGPLIPTFI